MVESKVWRWEHESVVEEEILQGKSLITVTVDTVAYMEWVATVEELLEYIERRSE